MLVLGAGLILNAATSVVSPVAQAQTQVQPANDEVPPDIIAEIARRRGDLILVGFAMESEHLIDHARKKLLEKGMDFIVANDVTEPGAGFQGDTNVIRILDREGGLEPFPLMDKKDAAAIILDRVKRIREARGARRGA